MACKVPMYRIPNTDQYRAYVDDPLTPRIYTRHSDVVESETGELFESLHAAARAAWEEREQTQWWAETKSRGVRRNTGLRRREETHKVLVRVPTRLLALLDKPISTSIKRILEQALRG